MNYKILGQFTVIALLLFSCATSGTKDPLLEEAFSYHQEAMAVHDSVVLKLKILGQRIADMPESDSLVAEFQNSKEEIERNFEQWDEALVPVPGYEVAHDHVHDHDHGQNDLKDLPAEKVLELQKELKMEITRIQDQANALLASF